MFIHTIPVTKLIPDTNKMHGNVSNVQRINIYICIHFPWIGISNSSSIPLLWYGVTYLMPYLNSNYNKTAKVFEL